MEKCTTQLKLQSFLSTLLLSNCSIRHKDYGAESQRTKMWKKQKISVYKSYTPDFGLSLLFKVRGRLSLAP